LGYRERKNESKNPIFSRVWIVRQRIEFTHVTSSPKYLQSNGEAESGIKIIKRILKKCKDVHKVLSYILWIMYSSAKLIFSRKVRPLVPMLPAKLGTFINHKKVSVFEKEKKINCNGRLE